MRDLLIAMAKMLPEEKLVTELLTHLNEYQKTNSKDSKGSALIYLSMLFTRWSTEGKDLDSVLGTMNKIEKIHDTFKNKEN